MVREYGDSIATSIPLLFVIMIPLVSRSNKEQRQHKEELRYIDVVFL